MDPEIVKALLDTGRDPNELPLVVNTKRSEHGQSNSAHMSDEESHEVENQDKADLNLLYPFHVAARPPTVEISFDKHKLRQQVVLDLLISRGADAYAPYPDGRFVF